MEPRKYVNFVKKVTSGARGGGAGLDSSHRPSTSSPGWSHSSSHYFIVYVL